MLSAGTVSEVTGDGEDALADALRIPRLAEADNVRKARMSLLVVMRESKATTNCHVEAEQLAVLNDGDEACAVSEEVHVVAWRDGHRDLELSRQVGESIQRLLLHRQGTLLPQDTLNRTAEPKPFLLKELSLEAPKNRKEKGNPKPSKALNPYRKDLGAHNLNLLSHLRSLHEEDLMIGAGSGQAVVVDLVGIMQDLCLGCSTQRAQYSLIKE